MNQSGLTFPSAARFAFGAPHQPVSRKTLLSWLGAGVIAAALLGASLMAGTTAPDISVAQSPAATTVVSETVVATSVNPVAPVVTPAVAEPATALKLDYRLTAVIPFSNGRTWLGDEGNRRMKDLLPKVRDAQGIEAVGFSAHKAPGPYQEKLAFRRAETAKSFMTKNGVPAENIEARAGKVIPGGEVRFPGGGWVEINLLKDAAK